VFGPICDALAGDDDNGEDPNGDDLEPEPDPGGAGARAPARHDRCRCLRVTCRSPVARPASPGLALLGAAAGLRRLTRGDVA
jgi:hypothetical protein